MADENTVLSGNWIEKSDGFIILFNSNDQIKSSDRITGIQPYYLYVFWLVILLYDVLV